MPDVGMKKPRFTYQVKSGGWRERLFVDRQIALAWRVAICCAARGTFGRLKHHWPNGDSLSRQLYLSAHLLARVSAQKGYEV